MQKRPNINWRKADVEKLENVIKRFNAKVSYNEKKHPDTANIMPDKVKKTEFMKDVKTRQDFNREIKSLERFLNKGAEKPIVSKTGNVVTKWEKKEIGIKVATINRERAKELKRIEQLDVTTHGLPTGLKRGEMGSQRVVSLQPKKYDFDKIKKGKEWEMFVRSVNKQALSENKTETLKDYKMNYLKGIYNVFGEYGENVARLIKQLPPELVTDIYFKEQEASIEFIYDPHELQVKLDIIEEIWEKAKNDNSQVVGNDNWSSDEETSINEWLENRW